MPLVDPVHRFVLFTNAKAGGTTLKAWFFDNLDFPTLHRRPATLLSAYGPRYAAAHLRRGFPMARAVARSRREAPGSEEYKRRVRGFIDFYRSAYCRSAMQGAGPAGDYRRICVVRHPEQRVVSGYLDKFCTPRADGDLPLVKDVLRAMGRDDLSFWQFLDYLEAVDEDACNPHWRQQSYILDGQRVDRFVRLEALHEEMSEVCDIVGAGHLPALQRRLKATREGEGEARAEFSADLAHLPSAAIAALRESEGRFPPAASFLTPEACERIRKIYAADFSRLPYD